MSKKKNMYKLESLARLISGRTPEREQKGILCRDRNTMGQD